MDKETVALVIAGVVTILGVLIPGIVSIITALRTQRAVEAVALVNEKQTGKLDGIGVQLDGQRTEMLARVATLEGLLAKKSGDPERAADATKSLDDHREAKAVAAAKETTDG